MSNLLVLNGKDFSNKAFYNFVLKRRNKTKEKKKQLKKNIRVYQASVSFRVQLISVSVVTQWKLTLWCSFIDCNKDYYK